MKIKSVTFKTNGKSESQNASDFTLTRRVGSHTRKTSVVIHFHDKEGNKYSAVKQEGATEYIGYKQHKVDEIHVKLEGEPS